MAHITTPTSGAGDTPQVRFAHSTAQERYEAFIRDAHGNDELVGYLDYLSEVDQVVITHTVIFDRYTHHGFGAALVRHVLDDIARTGRPVVPVCSFVRGFVHDNPSYAPMMASA